MLQRSLLFLSPGWSSSTVLHMWWASFSCLPLLTVWWPTWQISTSAPLWELKLHIIMAHVWLYRHFLNRRVGGPQSWYGHLWRRENCLTPVRIQFPDWPVHPLVTILTELSWLSGAVWEIDLWALFTHEEKYLDLYFSLLERTLLHTPDCSLGGLERVQKCSLLSVTGVAEKGRGICRQLKLQQQVSPCVLAELQGQEGLLKNISPFVFPTWIFRAPIYCRSI